MMRRTLFLSLAAAAAVCVSLPSAETAAARAAAQKSVPGKQALAYGADPLQQIDYWPAAGSKSPLVLFVHGGGWKRGDKDMVDGSPKLTHWHGQGYAVASVNYRLIPEAIVEQQAADIAEAVSFLRANAVRLGFDPERIALVGHSAGAHLVALVGTDARWFNGAGLTFADIAGVVSLDGAAYDVPAQMEDGARIMQPTYRQAFGSDPARQAKLSPTLQAGAPNAAEFLILHVQRDDGARQSAALAHALRQAGTAVELREFAGKGLRGHREMNRRLGDPAYPATAVVDAFLARVFG
jgi:acetyl esterase/lipase